MLSGGASLGPNKEELERRLKEKETRLSFEIEQRLEVCKKSTRYRREAILAKKELKQLQERLTELESKSFVASL